MAKSEEIERLEKSIRDAYTKIVTVFSNIEAISREIELLANKEKELEENIKCLKKEKVVAVAQEFKKSKQDLKKISAKMSILDSDKKHFLKVSETIQDFIEKCKKELEKIQNLNKDNVLQFKNKGKNE